MCTETVEFTWSQVASETSTPVDLSASRAAGSAPVHVHYQVSVPDSKWAEFAALFQQAGSADVGGPDFVVRTANGTTFFEIKRYGAGHKAEESDLAGKKSLVVIDGVAKAIDAQIYDSDSEVAIRDNDTGVFGGGHDLAAAVRDLRDALQEHFAVLVAESAPLSAGLQEQLEVLRSYFPTP
jgi:hypothetical protein